MPIPVQPPKQAPPAIVPVCRVGQAPWYQRLTLHRHNTTFLCHALQQGAHACPALKPAAHNVHASHVIE